jgi:LuxR family maltose regulon positive regulatory protein
MRGELVEIRAADLRFTADEVAAYLNDVAGLGLADGDIAVLEHRTEGWVAALQLAALSIRGHEDVRGFISRFAGNDRSRRQSIGSITMTSATATRGPKAAAL